MQKKARKAKNREGRKVAKQLQLHIMMIEKHSHRSKKAKIKQEHLVKNKLEKLLFYKMIRHRRFRRKFFGSSKIRF